MENIITYTRHNGYYIVLVNGKFHCSCDDLTEVQEEINRLKQEAILLAYKTKNHF